MTNERGWKDGVYNPGFAPMKSYLERKAKEFAEAGIEFPEIKGVRFRQGVIRRKPRLFFDPFNMTGLPDHILNQVKDDYYFWYNDYAMRQEFQVLELRLEEARKTTPIDPQLQDLFDRGLISQGQLDQVTLLRGKPTDMYSDIFAKPIGNIPVVPPDEDVPMFGGVPMVQSGINYTKHHSGKHRFHNPLREHWEKHGDPYEGRLPLGDPKLDAIVQDLLQEHSDPELAAKVKRSILGGVADLDIADSYPKTVGMPRELCTPGQIADAEAAIQEAAEGKLDYLLEGTQWDPKLRK